MTAGNNGEPWLIGVRGKVRKKIQQTGIKVTDEKKIPAGETMF